MGVKVFISYSHKDREALERFQRFLLPLERKELVNAWDDTRIKQGDDWKAEVDKALADSKVAVLFISQDFLASKFISEEELPHLLAARTRGDLTIIPVFLNHSNVDLVCEELTRIQGYGSPQQPLSTLRPGEQEKIYAELSRRITELADAAPSVRPPASRRSGQSLPVSAEARSYELTVHLERNGKNLDTRYLLPGNDQFLSTSRTWADIEKAINPVITMLDEGDSDEIQGLIKTAPAHWGAVFFELLFGADTKDHPTIFRTAFHQPPPQAQPNPIRAPLRLRIASDNPQLLGLPWRLTAWERRSLIDNGWIFLTSQADDPTIDHVTTAPCEVLIIAPAATNEGLAPDPNHTTALAEVSFFTS